MSLGFRDIFSNSYTRFLLGILVGLIALSSTYVVVHYHQTVQSSKDIAFARLETIAHTLSQQVDGHEIGIFLKEYSTKDTLKVNYAHHVYHKYQKVFEQVKTANELSTDIYTIQYDSLSKAFTFGISSASKPYFLHPYPSAPDDHTGYYYNGGIREPYGDDHGHWISAIQPIRNRHGDIVCAIQVDIRFDEFISNARTRAIKESAYIGGFLLVLGFVIIKLIFDFLKKEGLQKQKIQAQADELRAKNEHITSSIYYAKQIQQAILPPIDAIQQVFPESFVFYQPKDIVSGDFYFFTKKTNGAIYLSAADCTGHGVPGALMSMISTTLLNEAINIKSVTDPAEILCNVEAGLLAAFKQDGSSSDGMDLALCRHQIGTNRIQFAGAYRPLMIVRKGELIEIKANRFSIGGERKEGQQFLMQEVELEKDDMVYMFSDGYPDQIGGPDEKKYMIKHFKSLLTQIAPLSIQEQEQELMNVLDQWKGNSSQVDDIIVLGFRF